MENPTADYPNKKVLVTLFSDSNFLSINILESLLSKNCFVNIVTDDLKAWNIKTEHLTGRSRFSVLSPTKFKTSDFGYAIIVGGFLKGEPYEDINNIFRKNNLSNSKNLIIIPFEKYSFTESSHQKISDNTGVVYMGDLLGPRMDLTGDLLAADLIRKVIFDRTISLGIGEVIYPIFVTDAAKTITKWLFSFGPYGKETVLFGPRVSGPEFWKENKNLIGEVSVHYDEKLTTRVVPKGLDIKTIPGSLKFALTETYKWFSDKSLEKEKRSLRSKPFIAVNIKKPKYPKFLKPLVISVVAVLLLPLFLLISSSGLYFVSYREFISGNDPGAANAILIAKTFSVIAKTESEGLAYIPLVGAVYKEVAFASGISERLSNIAIAGVPVAREASTLADKVLGNEVYDPSISSQKITEGLDSMYREASLLQVDTADSAVNGVLIAKLLENRFNFEKLTNTLLQGKNLAQNLSALTGKGQSKTYMLLFQNNMELRPTGGFIGSFGILTLDSGRITDLVVNDVYSADGQLNGHVEPPAPIKKYLGEANWWLRDSNWDPDFPTSAKRAEWFLDKETGRQVDGVIAIDLQPIRDILKYTGPIFLPDFNLSISSDNLYQKTQDEVQDNFFPGTHKKASFLTALSRSLLAEVSKLSTTQKIGILKSFYGDLEGRHIQAFLHDDSSQNALSSLEWDGAIPTPACGDACYPDIVGIVEANVGVNKANYFIKRTEDLAVRISSNKITRTLSLNLEDNANPALGPSGRYKVYVRLLTPLDAQILSIKAVTGEVPEDLAPETSDLKGRKESGVLVEILGGQSKKIVFSWETPIQNTVYTKYGIYMRKQAGVTDDPFTLTINGHSVYNTVLASDYFNRFSFQ